ncbi:MAG: hypothetical protein JW720_10695 [Sedimentisphaerales bacterium]|nr:hypothetical protein [Sedimentisphaerales bacterium]
MDPNIVQVDIVGFSLVSDVIIPFASAIVGVVVGAIGSFLLIRWQVKRSHELEIKRQKDNEAGELQNMYKSLLAGAKGYWQSIGPYEKTINSLKRKNPTFLFGGPVSHSLPGYEENVHLIPRIKDRQLLEMVMASHYSIGDFTRVMVGHNNLFKEYEDSHWRAIRSKDTVDRSQAEQRLEELKVTTDTVQQRFECMKNNLTDMIDLLQKIQEPSGD